jgi:hypothetical protein
MNALIQDLKENGQDFEFYPTTDEILRDAVKAIKDTAEEYHGHYYNRPDFKSVLDIGAGNGKALEAFRAALPGLDCFAIEKSGILRGQLPNDVYVIGTEFEQQSLFSKGVDFIFCNPPYSVFEQWTVKIIRESAAPYVFLVIPERWQSSLAIADALKRREAQFWPVGDYTFEEADRAARCRVQLVKIHFPDKKQDAFETFFKETFGEFVAKFDKPKEEAQDTEDKGGKRRRPFQSLVPGEDYPARLVNLYTGEMAHIQGQYDKLKDLDADLLREFEIFPAKVMGALRERLKGLRVDYWSELFTRIRAITDRLTSKSRDRLLKTLQGRTDVDFTVDNISAVIIWALKNANDFITEQFLSTYETMIDKANVTNYKSNAKKFEQGHWNYQYDPNKNENSHFKLETRIVLDRVGGISCATWNRWEDVNGLRKSAGEFLGDLLTVANNLGFLTDTQPPALTRDQYEWTSGKVYVFNWTKRGKVLPLVEARAFQNGNMHLRFSPEFMLALNVEHGRLKGWIRSKEEAADELQDKDAPKYFKITHQFLPASGMAFLPAPADVDPEPEEEPQPERAPVPRPRAVPLPETERAPLPDDLAALGELFSNAFNA